MGQMLLIRQDPLDKEEQVRSAAGPLSDPCPSVAAHPLCRWNNRPCGGHHFCTVV